jgi:nicotinamidase/pyrazinamidase
MKTAYIVVDMQNDFLTMALGSPECNKALKPVLDILRNKVAPDDLVLVTKDTHEEISYSTTKEGKSIPAHCIKGTIGWDYPLELKEQLDKLRMDHEVVEFEKPTFGSADLFAYLLDHKEEIDRVYILGVCSSICVHAQAVLARTALKDADIYLVRNAIGDFSKEAEETTILALKAMQVDTIEKL